MVLQQGSQGAEVWGYSSSINDTVEIYLDNTLASTTVVHGHSPLGTWVAKVHNTIGSYQAHILTASSSLGNVSITDVKFGDVWLCSGQSNMAFGVRQLMNATDEYADAANFQDIRIMKVPFHKSAHPLIDLGTTNHWSLPNNHTLAAFSAVCWLYAKYLSQELNYPIGVVESSVGGTRIESWSSPDALNSCANRTITHGRVADHELWNGMIYPFIRTTLYGAIWYQGESNSGHYEDYSCLFPAMINDWRAKFYRYSRHTTSSMLPFGFVQLATSDPHTHNTYPGFALIRWTQTAGYGKAPNPQMPNTFMAVAMDLPDQQSPYGSIHPRYKHAVADRLVTSALVVAYHKTGIDFQGPYPSNFVQDAPSHSLTISYDNGNKPIEVRVNTGFEVCCSHTGDGHDCTDTSSNWVQALISGHDTSSVTLDTSKCHGNTKIHGVRYTWSHTPCALLMCAVYGSDSGLPAPSFIHKL